jgi:hypothetical protein
MTGEISTGDPAADPVRLAPSAARCPHCRRMPPLRLYVQERHRFEAEPTRPVLTYECKCGHRYDLTAAAFQGAA